jgi:glycerol-3-phosphate O-acyltransferase
MISGKKELITFRDFVTRTVSLKQDYLGEIYVKFLEPLAISDFLKESGYDNFNLKQTREVALKLTRYLYLRQSKEQPVTLNAIIAGCLLLERSPQITMKDLLARTTIIFDYIKLKENCKRLMNIPPQQPLVEKHVTGLGFKMKN